MSKKLLTVLASLLAATAFAVMPVAAQAEPHVYKNGSIQKEAKPLPTIAWGILHLKNTTLGEVTCKNLFAGNVENPTGGGAAVGTLFAFDPYECESASCKALGGTKIEVKSENLPYVGVVTEPSAGVFRMKTGVSKVKGAAGNVQFLVNCEKVTKPIFFGEQAPLIQNNGFAIGSGPGEEELLPDAGTGALESEIGEGKTEGKVKVEGYNAEELIEVKNP